MPGAYLSELDCLQKQALALRLMLDCGIFPTDMETPATHSASGIAITGIEDDNPDRAYGRESLDFTKEPFLFREGTTAWAHDYLQLIALAVVSLSLTFLKGVGLCAL